MKISRRTFLKVCAGGLALGLAGDFFLGGKRRYSFGEARRVLKGGGYDLLDEKVVDAESPEYIIILGEIHNISSSFVASCIKDFIRLRLITGCGLENVVGNRGEDILERTRRSTAGTYLEHLSHIKNDSLFYMNYGFLLGQQSGIQAYGLEDVKLYERCLIGLDLLSDISLNFSDKRQVPIEEIKKRLENFGFKFSQEELENTNRLRGLYKRLRKTVDNIQIEQRNEVAISKINPGDAVLVGFMHVKGLKDLFPGNVLVPNSIKTCGVLNQALSKVQRKIYEAV